MCFAITQSKTINFNQRNATLTVLHEQCELIWGQRIFEKNNFPIGGWCREDLLNTGFFDQWFPKPVLLAVKSFCVRDFLGRAHWFDISAGEYLCGVVLTNCGEQRVYILLTISQRLDNLFWYWPKLTISLK